MGLRERDVIILLTSKFLRTFIYGLLTVSLVVYLKETGFTPFQIGLVISAAVVGGLVSTIMVVLFADSFGRQRSLSFLGLLTALTGIILTVSSGYLAVIIAVFLGSLSLTGGEAGPFLTIEQTIIPQLTTEPQRNRAFSFYNFIGYAGLSLGFLAGLVPGYLGENLGFNTRESYLPVFIMLVLFGIALALLYRNFDLQVEAMPSSFRSRISLPRSSRRTVLKLSSLFGLDSFAGGFVIQSIVILWLSIQFGVGPSSLSEIIAAGQVVTAVSILVAGRLGDRFGLLNTMVFTHVASNLFLASIAFAPNLRVALGLYLARQSLSQMDVPTRQAYTMALVPPDERTPAAGVTTLVRNGSQSISPSIAGYLLDSLPGFLGATFLVGGGIKIAYDILVYTTFRNTSLPDEPSQQALEGEMAAKTQRPAKTAEKPDFPK